MKCSVWFFFFKILLLLVSPKSWKRAKTNWTWQRPSAFISFFDFFFLSKWAFHFFLRQRFTTTALCFTRTTATPRNINLKLDDWRVLPFRNFIFFLYIFICLSFTKVVVVLKIVLQHLKKTVCTTYWLFELPLVEEQTHLSLVWKVNRRNLTTIAENVLRIWNQLWFLSRKKGWL